MPLLAMPLPAAFLLLAIHQAPPPDGATPAGDADPRPPSTLKMVELLKECTARVDPKNAPFVNDVRVPLIRADIPNAKNPAQQRLLRETLAKELLQDGQTQAAIDELLALRAEYIEQKPKNAPIRLPAV